MQQIIQQKTKQVIYEDCSMSINKVVQKVRVLRENSDLRPDYAESKTSLTKYYIKMTFSNQKEII